MVRSIVKLIDEYEQEKKELALLVTLNINRSLPPVSVEHNISENLLNILNPNDISVDTVPLAIDKDIESDLEDSDLNDITIDNIIEDMILSKETGENKENRENGKNENESKNSLHEVLQSIDDNTKVEDFDLQRITNYSFENSYLYLLSELKSRETIPVLFEKLKYHFPLEMV